MAYLERRGWGKRATDLRGTLWSVWERDGFVLEVPMLASASDYPRRFLELLTELAKIEQRPIPEILEDMAKE